MSKKYNDTLNLPKTDFQMKAHLSEKEPEMLSFWENSNIYNKILEKNKNNERFILHDGPPYANGNIHLGHALNKILKDFIIKYKLMNGYYAPFRPGWDTHGLPTEIKAKNSVENCDRLTIPDLRKICKETALKYVDSQRKSFERLGIFADWKNPYITLQKEYESKQIEIFAKMARNGAIYRGAKPVYWCPSCETALAEAEIEYKHDKCKSIFVKFMVKKASFKSSKFKNIDNLYFLVWTTTAWTLPANVAICVNPFFDYSFVQIGNDVFIMASDRVRICMKELNIIDYKIYDYNVKGRDLEGTITDHPFINRESIVITGNHVNLEAGTGCVHTAPGHGIEDFECCTRYNFEILVPVDERGKMNSQAGEFCGMSLNEASNAIIEKLRLNGSLFACKDMVHKYPHCWRCKEAVILRVTRQWFCSVKKFRDKALKSLSSIKWFPSWGQDRMYSMIEDRSDWCISRQRKWGVPLPIFFCESCGTPFVNYETIMNVSKIFREYGSGIWFEKNADFFMTGREVCACGFSKFIKEKDIMDVWLDSGVSYYASLDEKDFPADLYLEGSDQFRGWFQSSLMTSIISLGKPPFKNVLTHGWVVDEESRKQSKSLGNVISPMDIINKYGADILRLWIASSDYQDNVKISNEILSQISESYRKIRNTARFILGNLYDFDPMNCCISFDFMKPIDKFILIKLKEINKKCIEYYEKFEFYSVFHEIQKFCISDLSNFYLDIIKDRLYVSKKEDKVRRACQTAIWVILTQITKILSPILSFTCEEIWKFIPKLESFESVFMNDMSLSFKISDDKVLEEYWDKVIETSDLIKKNLEVARQDKIIGSSLEANIKLKIKLFDNDVQKLISDLKEVCMCSEIEILESDVDAFEINISKSKYLKCARCWMHDISVGKNVDHEDLCERCIKVLN